MTNTNWQKVKLSDVLQLNYGFGLPKRDRKDGKVPVYGSSGVDGYHNDAAVKSQGIILGRKGNVGAVYFSDIPFFPIDTVYFIADIENGDLKFFYYMLKTIDFKKLMTDVGVPGLNRNIAHDIDLTIPKNAPTQHRIASILSAFDDKIELNNKINKTLEQMAQAIFKEWFEKNVDDLPKGWNIKQFNDLAEIIKGKKPKNIFKNKQKNCKQYLLIDSFTENKKYYTDDINLPSCERNESVIVMDGASSGKIFSGKEGIVGSTLAVIKPKKAIYNHFLLFFLRFISKELQENTTGSAIPHVDKDFLRNYQIILPDEKLLKRFSELIDPMIKKINITKKENQTLSTLRDTLLPKLMSGEVRVKV